MIAPDTSKARYNDLSLDDVMDISPVRFSTFKHSTVTLPGGEQFTLPPHIVYLLADLARHPCGRALTDAEHTLLENACPPQFYTEQEAINDFLIQPTVVTDIAKEARYSLSEH